MIVLLLVYMYIIFLLQERSDIVSKFPEHIRKVVSAVNSTLNGKVSHKNSPLEFTFTRTSMFSTVLESVET